MVATTYGTPTPDEMWVIKATDGEDNDSVFFLQSHNPSGDCWTTSPDSAFVFYVEECARRTAALIEDWRSMKGLEVESAETAIRRGGHS